MPGGGVAVCPGVVRPAQDGAEVFDAVEVAAVEVADGSIVDAAVGVSGRDVVGVASYSSP